MQLHLSIHASIPPSIQSSTHFPIQPSIYLPSSTQLPSTHSSLHPSTHPSTTPQPILPPFQKYLLSTSDVSGTLLRTVADKVQSSCSDGCILGYVGGEQTTSSSQKEEENFSQWYWGTGRRWPWVGTMGPSDRVRRCLSIPNLMANPRDEWQAHAQRCGGHLCPRNPVIMCWCLYNIFLLIL